MQSLLRLSAAAVTLAAILPAQDIVVPDLYASVGGPGTSGLVWRNSEFQCQILYDTTHFTDRGIDHPITITRLQWRSNTVGNAGSYAAVQVNMSTSPSDYAGMSTTFATNVGPDNTIVYNGPVSFVQGNGVNPGNYVIDIVLTTPFVYNPASGNDLLIEMVTAAAPSAAPPQMDCATDYLVARARRNSTASATAATGGLSSFAPVMQLDYTEPAGLARKSTYGNGCYNRPASFYELFGPGAFDLAGTSTTVNSLQLTPLGNGGYAVSPGSNQWFTPATADLGLGDDSLSPPQALPFTFNYTGGSTTVIEIGSNGSVWMQAGGSTSPGASVDSLLSEVARLVPLWTDLDPSAATGAGSVHFDVDPTGQTVYVTWVDVPLWELAPSTHAYRNNIQVALYSTGLVEFRYGACDTTSNQSLTGFSPGGGVVDPGNRDISATMPFATGDGNVPLGLDASARPVLGTTLSLTTTDIPAGTPVGALIFGFTQNDPGLSLAGIGMPGCFRYASLDITVLMVTAGSSASVPLAVPANASLIGAPIYAQSATFSSGFNTLGVISSNGLALLVGGI